MGVTGPAPRVAVISGGSSGIGLAIAHELAGRGFHLWLLARRPDRLDAAKAELLARHPALPVATLPLDVTDAAATSDAIALILREAGRIDWLVTSAGTVEPGLFLDQPIEAHRRQMEINHFGTLHLVKPVAEAMRAQGGGRITLISSAAAFAGIAGYSGYVASKFAVRALGETLQVELAQHGTAVGVAFPPDTDTPQYKAEQATKPEITKAISAGGGVLSAETVARSIVRGAERGRFLLTPSPLMTAFGWLHSLYAPLFRHQQRRKIAELARKKGAP
ncbi:SDR family oxidoreductase [Rhabdaerophilum sp.]|uniref:SDR family oxidoreductase n=1 Tax=Rhabdaerophilum sp. TaxID=2717341 RepID=UPI0038D3DD7C